MASNISNMLTRQCL